MSITMPMLSPSFKQAIIHKWHVQNGQNVQPGELLFDVYTESLTEHHSEQIVQVEIHEEGVIQNIKTNKGDIVKPNQKLAELVCDEDEHVNNRQWAWYVIDEYLHNKSMNANFENRTLHG